MLDDCMPIFWPCGQQEKCVLVRSRRQSYRRSTSQAAAGLLSLALPAPVRGVASTRLGSKLMLVGLPALVGAGLIHINLENGAPRISIDHNKATELRSQVNRFDTQGHLQQWGRSASEFLQPNQGQSPTPYGSTAQRSTAGFPSTQQTPTPAQGNWQYNADHLPVPYAPTGYAQSPNYSPASPQASVQASVPANRQYNAWNYQQQQPIPTTQQQLYEQQLRQQQYQQWQAQQQSLQYGTSPQTVAPPYPQTNDPYGRTYAPAPTYNTAPQVSNGYVQPSYNGTGQVPAYSQGSLPDPAYRNRY